MENPNVGPQEKQYLKNSKPGTGKPRLLYQPNVPRHLFCSPAAVQWLHRSPPPGWREILYRQNCKGNGRTSKSSGFGVWCRNIRNVRASMANLALFLQPRASQESLPKAHPAVLLSPRAAHHLFWPYLQYFRRGGTVTAQTGKLAGCFPPFAQRGCAWAGAAGSPHASCPGSSPPAAGIQAATAQLTVRLPWGHPDLCPQAPASCLQLDTEITTLGILCSQKMIDAPKCLGPQTHLLWHRDVPGLALLGYQPLRQQ